MNNFADRLTSAIDAKGSPVCVGVDPVYESLPQSFRADAAVPDEQVTAIGRWCGELLEVVAPLVPAVKPQSAYFEAYGPAGVGVYYDVVAKAHQLGLLVIGDVKRNDIGSTAKAYAAGHLAAANSPDAITVNGYLGADGISPFIDVCKSAGKGIFVLVRTSNPSAAAIQDFADASGKRFYEHIAEQVAALGEGLVGECGFSSVGAVVGATYPDEARRLRKIMPRQLFLVPGYGAQGATAADCAASFDAAGRGAVVNASRSVIFAHKTKSGEAADWKRSVADAARAFAEDIKQAVRPG